MNQIDETIVSKNEQEAAAQVRTIGFTADLGIELLRLEPGRCECELRLESRHLNTLSIVHGGVLYSLADTASSLAAASYGGGGSTVSGSIDYLRAAKGTTLHCTAEVVKYGRHLIWTSAEITDDLGKVCCKSQFIHYQMEGAANFGIQPVFKEDAPTPAP
ncbi:MAG: PaaI family thioesterase [Clostridia bacterium]|nr:PaaI family thioesterase [Clostridia bacterium]